MSLSFSAVADYAYILQLDSTSVYPVAIYPNSEVSINLTVSNISNLSDAQNVEVSLTANPNYFDTIKETDYLDIIKFNQTGTTSLAFKVKATTSGGYYTLPIQITYLRDNVPYTIDTSTTINVSNYDRINLVLTEYPLDKKYLDENLEIKGYVKNEGNTTLNGIFVSLSYGQAKFIPLTETSQFIGDLLPNQERAYIFNLIIPKSAEPGIYDLNITAIDIASHSDIEKVAFIVEDNPTLIISSIDKSLETGKTYLAQDSHFSLSVQLENISKSKARSASIEIIKETTDIEGEKIAYVGSIDASDSGAGVFDLYVTPDADIGEQLLRLKIIFTDEYDVEHTYEKDVSLYIDAKPTQYGWIFYIILIIIIGGAIYYFYKRREKTKKIRNI